MNTNVATAAAVRASEIYMAPSEIRFIDSTGCRKGASIHGPRPTTFSPDTAGQQDTRLQAVEMEGLWFALDRDLLELYQRLEKEGNCQRIKVEAVAPTQLSEETRSMISETVTSIKNGIIPDTPVIQGYHQMVDGEGKMDNAMTDSMTETDHHSDSSGDGDSSSECDWSEDEGDSSDDNSETADGVDRKHRTLADGKSESSSDENEHLLQENSS